MSFIEGLNSEMPHVFYGKETCPKCINCLSPDNTCLNCKISIKNNINKYNKSHKNKITTRQIHNLINSNCRSCHNCFREQCHKCMIKWTRNKDFWSKWIYQDKQFRKKNLEEMPDYDGFGSRIDDLIDFEKTQEKKTEIEVDKHYGFLGKSDIHDKGDRYLYPSRSILINPDDLHGKRAKRRKKRTTKGKKRTTKGKKRTTKGKKRTTKGKKRTTKHGKD
jgi:hypothetical protein